MIFICDFTDKPREAYRQISVFNDKLKERDQIQADLSRLKATESHLKQQKKNLAGATPVHEESRPF